jgi:NhaA family Na+:H+ antiporter
MEARKHPRIDCSIFLHKPVAFYSPICNSKHLYSHKFNWYEGLNHPTRLVCWSGDWETTGIWLFSFVAVTLGICTLPKDLKWSNILGAGMLGGIGFTMSIFITLLAFKMMEKK